VKQIALLAAIAFSWNCYSQDNENKVFLNSKSWSEVLQIAKTEKKNIFVDAYTTWCLPCKKMDLEVYPDSEIIATLSEKFVSIKIQCDRLPHDSENIRNWYHDTDSLVAKHNITGYPSFLFFSPEGDLIYRESGYHNVKEFSSVLKIVNNPDNNYASEILRFKNGDLDSQALLNLARRSKSYQDDSLAYEIAKKYKKNYLDRAALPDALNESVRHFIVDFQKLFSLNDVLVKYLYHNKEVADKALKQKDFSRDFTEYLISAKLINDKIRLNGKYVNSEPDWKTLQKNITRSYDANTAAKLIVRAKIGWYENKKNWDKAIFYNFQNLDQYGIDSSIMGGSGINNMIYNLVFIHSNNAEWIKKGIKYMEHILKNYPDHDTWIDTYANLLYKAGNKEKAIQYENLALDIAKKRDDNFRIAEYKNVLDKITANKPTWINN
jgi:thioredoxin-related protein